MARSVAAGGLSALVLLGAGACAGPQTPSAPAGPDRSESWDAAVAYPEFVRGDTAHQRLWEARAALGAPADLVARARALTGDWRLLVVAESWCSDAVNAVPFLAALADSVPALELRVLRLAGNEPLFEGHERDGRLAHPLVLVLDGQGRERGAWVERPTELAAWIDERRGVLPDDDIRMYRSGWYEGNAGRAAVAEVVGLVGDIAAGRAPSVVVAPRTAGEVTPCAPATE